MKNQILLMSLIMFASCSSLSSKHQARDISSEPVFFGNTPEGTLVKINKTFKLLKGTSFYAFQMADRDGSPIVCGLRLKNKATEDFIVTPDQSPVLQTGRAYIESSELKPIGAGNLEFTNKSVLPLEGSEVFQAIECHTMVYSGSVALELQDLKRYMPFINIESP